MKTEEAKSILRAAIAKYGISHQIDMAHEEMGELIVALHHLKRGKATADAVITEIADVTIMIYQLAEMFGVEKVQAEIDRKLKRLSERMNNQQEEIFPQLAESEDERIRKEIRDLLVNACEADRRYPKLLAWLKSLRPQPKQDGFPSLSEKEIICLKRALDYLRKEHNRYGGEDFTNEIAVLEWLITYPILVSDIHWKPSKEQMEALDKALYYVPEEIGVPIAEIYGHFNKMKKKLM